MNIEKNLSSICFDQLQQNIIMGTFTPGQKLTLDMLKERLSIGHSPIREALARLATSGLVYSEDNKGFRVTPISEQDIRDVYRTFTQLEKLALSQAIELGTEVWEAEIVTTLYHLAQIETKKEPVEYCIWSPRNYAFHVALISGCNSPLLMQLRSDVYKRFDRYCRMAFNTTRGDLVPNHKEHQALATAVLSRDTDTTHQLIHYHINEPLEEIITLFRNNNMF